MPQIKKIILNNVSQCYHAIDLYFYSNFNIVKGNLANNNLLGIRTVFNTYNQILDNVASNNSFYGIILTGSSKYVSVINNTMSENKRIGLLVEFVIGGV